LRRARRRRKTEMGGKGWDGEGWGEGGLGRSLTGERGGSR